MNTVVKDRKLVVVLVDCWDYVFAYQHSDDFKYNFKNNLRKIAFENIHNFVLNNAADLIVTASYGYPMHSKLRPLKKLDNCIEILDLDEFENTVFVDDSPIDIYYMGAHWNACIRNRPIGWRNIQSVAQEKNIDCRILFKNKTLIDEIDGQFECWPDFDNDDETLSFKINDDTWQLVKDLIDRGVRQPE